MKKLIITAAVALLTTSVFASDHIERALGVFKACTINGVKYDASGSKALAELGVDAISESSNLTDMYMESATSNIKVGNLKQARADVMKAKSFNQKISITAGKVADIVEKCTDTLPEHAKLIELLLIKSATSK